MPLVLSRRPGQDVKLTIPADITPDQLQQLIEEGITVRITEMNDTHAWIGIHAPRVVSIFRAELGKPRL